MANGRASLACLPGGPPAPASVGAAHWYLRPDVLISTNALCRVVCLAKHFSPVIEVVVMKKWQCVGLVYDESMGWPDALLPAPVGKMCPPIGCARARGVGQPDFEMIEI